MTADIGARLRDARLARGLSLRSVAQALGVSASLISQVETGKTQPSVSTLYALVSHLGVSMDELLGTGARPASPADPAGAPLDEAVGPDSGSPVVRANEGAVLEMENGVRWERLAAATGGGSAVDPMVVTYEPGASSSVEGRMMRHAGVEYAYILEGELTLQLDFESYVLGPGDSLYFDSVRPHLYINQGTTIARGVWFVVGRRAQNSALPSATGADPAPPSQLTSAVDVLRAMDDLHG